MATAQDIANEVGFDILEDPPATFTLGVLTQAQFIDALNETLLDFLKQTNLVKTIYTQTIQAGVSRYSIPDAVLFVESAFVAGRYLDRSTQSDISGKSLQWKNQPGIPKVFHEDGLPPKTVELAPIPNYNGTYIPGTLEPDPPHGQFGGWAVTIGGSSVPPATHRGLTVVGTEKPALITSLADSIPLLPDEVSLGYIPFGVLARIFSSDSELKDAEKAAWADGQYQEGIQLMKAIACELQPEVSQ